jgi:uncharacterized membrane protein
MTRALREALTSKGTGAAGAFRWRGHEVTRLEGFTDAVFAFAVTLLVVSLEVPRTFEELSRAMRGFLPFAVCFAILIWIWYEHYVFFRRYGLRDPWTVFLNAVLIFVVLFYVYPLKFLFQLVLGPVSGLGTEVRRASGRIETMIETRDVPALFVTYGAGVAAVFLVLALLYFHAYRRRNDLALTEVEIFDTRSDILRHLEMAAVGALSMLLAAVLPPAAVGLAGYVYFLFGLAQWLHGSISRARRRRLLARLAKSAED